MEPRLTQLPVEGKKQRMNVRHIMLWVTPFIIGGVALFFISHNTLKMHGYHWFLPSILVGFWVATYLNAMPGALFTIAMGFLYIYFNSRFSWYGNIGYILNSVPAITAEYGMGGERIQPFVVAIFCGEIGSVLGAWIGSSAVSRSFWSIGLAIIGLVTGFVIQLFLVIGGIG